MLAAGCWLLAAGCWAEKSGSIVPGDEIDIGAVFPKETRQIRRAFRVVNPSNRRVAIREIKRTCTCTEATISRDDLGIGETADLTMQVDVAPIFNDWSVACTLVTDDPVAPEWTYRLKYRTYPPVRIENETLDLGSAMPSTAGQGRSPLAGSSWVEVYGPSAAKLDPKIEFDSPTALGIQLDSRVISDSLERGQVRRVRRRFTVSLKDGHPKEGDGGLFSGSVTARVADGDAASSVVLWAVPTPIVTSPSNLSFGVVNAADERSSRKVTLRARDGRPFRILGVAGASDEVTAENLAALAGSSPEPTQAVEFSFRRAKDTARFVAGRATIATDHPEMPTARISWSAIVP